MDFDFVPYIILGLLLLVPALIVFIIMTVLRVRRAKFHRQRVPHRKSNKTDDDKKEK